MSDSNYPLSITLKAGTGYDSPWIVVYAHTPDEAEQKLQAVANGGLIEATVNAANALKAANNAAPLAPQGQEAQQPQAQPVPQQAPQSAWGQQAPQQQPQGGFGGPQNGSPHPNGQQCTQCGSVLQYKAGTSKAGRVYKMWTCPNGRSRDDGHVTEFIR